MDVPFSRFLYTVLFLHLKRVRLLWYILKQRGQEGQCGVGWPPVLDVVSDKKYQKGQVVGHSTGHSMFATRRAITREAENLVVLTWRWRLSRKDSHTSDVRE